VSFAHYPTVYNKHLNPDKPNSDTLLTHVTKYKLL